MALWVYFMRKSGKVGERTINQLWREAIQAKSGQDFLIALTESINNKGNRSRTGGAKAAPELELKPLPRKRAARTTTTSKTNLPANPTSPAKPSAQPNVSATQIVITSTAEPETIIPSQTRGRHAKPDNGVRSDQAMTARRHGRT